ncbi:hypothetical protein [Pseudoduganella namucuonensis]|uniref:Uncharacterized protein n=1 Tax=Pseudoduganella namucuonensis TaxID=1035707 RepID=A0A1I7EZD7_9BURK|nr:hypothetical protein [Pseudoduganella namucuonensis]SFU29267.1 hypothetical protein SAMN05216552_1001264 [Pseudoduganella namucuonensis]
MAEDYVVTRELTRDMREAGARLLRELDKENVPVTAAYGSFDYESHRWMLFLVGPGIIERDDPDTYLEIRRVLDRLEEDGVDTYGVNYRLLDDSRAQYRELRDDVNFFRDKFSAPLPPRPPLGRKFRDDIHIYRMP